jgi:hypothetical protein
VLNLFRKKKDAIYLVWIELCELEKFLKEKFPDFMKKHADLEVEQWENIKRPLILLENEKDNIPHVLYDYVKHEIFEGCLFKEINHLLQLVNEIVESMTGNQNTILAKINFEVAVIKNNYTLRVREFKMLWENFESDRNNRNS